MKLKCFLVFVSIVVLPKLLFSLEAKIRTGFFKVVNKHPKIREYAKEILHQAEYSSWKVYKSGFCESMKGSLNFSSISKEFAYIQKLSLKTVFRSPTVSLANFPLSFTDLEQKHRAVALVTDSNILQNSYIRSTTNAIYLGSEMYNVTASVHALMIYRMALKEEGFVVRLAQGGFRNDDALGMLTFDHSQNPFDCDRKENLTGKKIHISMNFLTDLSLEVTMANLTSCVFNMSVPLRTFKGMSISGDVEVYSIMETYDEP